MPSSPARGEVVNGDPPGVARDWAWNSLAETPAAACNFGNQSAPTDEGNVLHDSSTLRPWSPHLSEKGVSWEREGRLRSCQRPAGPVFPPKVKPMHNHVLPWWDRPLQAAEPGCRRGGKMALTTPASHCNAFCPHLRNLPRRNRTSLPWGFGGRFSAVPKKPIQHRRALARLSRPYGIHQPRSWILLRARPQ